jgi:hypothetical protein
VITETETKFLPKEMQTMNVEQRKTYVKQKSAERTKIQGEIKVLSEKRKQYIAEKKPAKTDDTSLDGVMLKSIKEKGKNKDLSWK